MQSYKTGREALAAAHGGTIVVFPKRLPREYDHLAAEVRDPALQVLLIACSPLPALQTTLVSAPIEIPSLATRGHELDPIIAAYARDAMDDLGATEFLPIDHAWVRDPSAESLRDIEKGTARLAALRHAGSVSGAAALLGMAHASLGEWLNRRRAG